MSASRSNPSKESLTSQIPKHRFANRGEIFACRAREVSLHAPSSPAICFWQYLKGWSSKSLNIHSQFGHRLSSRKRAMCSMSSAGSLSRNDGGGACIAALPQGNGMGTRTKTQQTRQTRKRRCLGLGIRSSLATQRFSARWAMVEPYTCQAAAAPSLGHRTSPKESAS